MTRGTPNQLYKIVKTADNRFEKKDYKKALDGYKKALSMKPNKDIESHCYLKMGLSYQQLNNYADALGSFDKSISIQKSFAGFFYRGILFIDVQKYKDAIDNLKQCIKLNTNDNNAVLAYVNMGRAYILDNKSKDAIKVLKSALEIKSNDLNALLLLAETYKEMDDQDEAKKLYEKVLTFNQNKDAVIGLASIYLANNESQKAISLLKNYLQEHQDPELFKIKGEIHFSLHDYENALFNFKKARKITNTEHLAIREARCLLALEKPNEAKELLENFISDQKSYILAKIFLSKIYTTNRESSKASELLNELIQTDQNIRSNAELSLAVADAFLFNNELEKAEDFLVNANQLGVQRWDITKQLVNIAIEKKEYDTALSRIEKLFSLSENSSQVGLSYHLKAITYYNQELYEETIKVTEDGLNELKKNKNDQYYILLIIQAKAKLKLNLTAETEKIIQNALNENPQIRPVVENDSELNFILK